MELDGQTGRAADLVDQEAGETVALIKEPLVLPEQQTQAAVPGAVRQVGLA